MCFVDEIDERVHIAGLHDLSHVKIIATDPSFLGTCQCTDYRVWGWDCHRLSAGVILGISITKWWIKSLCCFVCCAPCCCPASSHDPYLTLIDDVATPALLCASLFVPRCLPCWEPCFLFVCCCLKEYIYIYIYIADTNNSNKVRRFIYKKRCRCCSGIRNHSCLLVGGSSYMSVGMVGGRYILVSFLF